MNGKMPCFPLLHILGGGGVEHVGEKEERPPEDLVIPDTSEKKQERVPVLSMETLFFRPWIEMYRA